LQLVTKCRQSAFAFPKQSLDEPLANPTFARKAGEITKYFPRGGTNPVIHIFPTVKADGRRQESASVPRRRAHSCRGGNAHAMTAAVAPRFIFSSAATGKTALGSKSKYHWLKTKKNTDHQISVSLIFAFTD
jgi:hypothetical protein